MHHMKEPLEPKCIFRKERRQRVKLKTKLHCCCCWFRWLSRWTVLAVSSLLPICFMFVGTLHLPFTKMVFLSCL